MRVASLCVFFVALVTPALASMETVLRMATREETEHEKPLVPGAFICSALGEESDLARGELLLDARPARLDQVVSFQAFNGCYRFDADLRVDVRRTVPQGPLLVTDERGDFRMGMVHEVVFAIRGIRTSGYVFSLMRQ